MASARGNCIGNGGGRDNSRRRALAYPPPLTPTSPLPILTPPHLSYLTTPLLLESHPSPSPSSPSVSSLRLSRKNEGEGLASPSLGSSGELWRRNTCGHYTRMTKRKRMRRDGRFQGSNGGRAGENERRGRIGRKMQGRQVGKTGKERIRKKTNGRKLEIKEEGD